MKEKGSELVIIRKILNNNVVVSKNEQNKEQILVGSGIAFQKKVGDFVSEKKVEKTYTLSSSDMSNKLQELLANLPVEYLKLSDDIISYAKTKLGKRLNDSIYISLTDHVYTAIERSKQNILVKNVLLWDIKRFFSDEFQIGVNAITLIEEQTKIHLPDDEAGFIALHIVNAEMDNTDIHNTYEITKIMQEITNIVKYNFNITFNEDSVYFYRFTSHLKFFAQRLVNKKNFENDNDDGLLDIIKLKYKNAYECVNKVGKFILDKYSYEISNEEKLYLTIHIARIVYNNDH